jgi:hypothetical protein
MDSFFHWLAQPYHVPDGLHTNGTFVAYVLLCMGLAYIWGYLSASGRRK